MAGRGRSRARTTVLGVALLTVLASGRPATAALGEKDVSIEADRLYIQGTVRTVSMSGYVVHEIQAPTGVVIRELAALDGTVFGLSWDGPFLPDLRRLLGAYYDTYVKAARSQRPRRGPLVLQLPDLVFESGGHPRSFHGRAYAPALVPAGVQADEIR